MLLTCIKLVQKPRRFGARPPRRNEFNVLTKSANHLRIDLRETELWSGDPIQSEPSEEMLRDKELKGKLSPEERKSTSISCAIHPKAAVDFLNNVDCNKNSEDFEKKAEQYRKLASDMGSASTLEGKALLQYRERLSRQSFYYWVSQYIVYLYNTEISDQTPIRVTKSRSHFRLNHISDEMFKSQIDAYNKRIEDAVKEGKSFVLTDKKVLLEYLQVETTPSHESEEEIDIQGN